MNSMCAFLFQSFLCFSTLAVVLAAGDGRYLSLNLTNVGDVYTVEVGVGTPPQKLHAILDTGSSDMWVKASTAHGDERTMYDSPTFDYTRSTSLRKTGYDFFINYIDTSSTGFWVTEKVTVGDVELVDFQHAVVNHTTTSVPAILGIGFQDGESIIGYPNSPNFTYPNFPVALKEQGYIDEVAYSLYLGAEDRQDGTLTFGAIDHARYVGNLYTFPVVNVYHFVSTPVQLHITLQGVGISESNFSAPRTLYDVPSPALVDTGTNGIIAPANIVFEIASKLNAVFDDEHDIFVFDCDLFDKIQTTILKFNFGDLTIDTPLANLLITAEDLGGSQCGLSLMPDERNRFILGVPFLRSVYAVFDLERAEITLAQANLQPGEQDLQVIHDEVPGAIRATAQPWVLPPGDSPPTRGQPLNSTQEVPKVPAATLSPAQDSSASPPSIPITTFESSSRPAATPSTPPAEITKVPQTANCSCHNPEVDSVHGLKTCDDSSVLPKPLPVSIQHAQADSQNSVTTLTPIPLPEPTDGDQTTPSPAINSPDMPSVQLISTILAKPGNSSPSQDHILSVIVVTEYKTVETTATVTLVSCAV
ncbi:HDL074Wp [Eremothecium sinecaudum]|uniref:HDL074Wp n=1 Tax=Eremothecium sinecaudum TaxID=45286 RepID=A0A109UZ07_9SACH|nr:HDL074Wp [Eremothecium sinecaudum]AMD20670.1 HDL074Wp [Eremothecium sinecaudum]